MAPAWTPTVAVRPALSVGGRRSTTYEAQMARIASPATTSATRAAKPPHSVASVPCGTGAGGGWATMDFIALMRLPSYGVPKGMATTAKGAGCNAMPRIRPRPLPHLRRLKRRRALQPPPCHLRSGRGNCGIHDDRPLLRRGSPH